MGGDVVQGASDFHDGTAGDVGVALAGAKSGMAEEFLNVTDVGAVFKTAAEAADFMRQVCDQAAFQADGLAEKGYP
jgi:hypothetical protein